MSIYLYLDKLINFILEDPSDKNANGVNIVRWAKVGKQPQVKTYPGNYNWEIVV